MSLASRVRHFSRLHDLWRPETRVIAAASGGSDSVALLFLLHELHVRGELQLDAVVHLNHAIRGQAADDDERFCCALAERLQVPFVSRTVDVPAAAERARVSLEVAARQARQQFFSDVRLSRGADAVATAHTRDDQAETVLLRLVRGTGVRGLGGIAPRRGTLIRPVLGCTREELRAHLIAGGETWREDQTNTDLANPRNRVRHELLPYLQRAFNPSMPEALLRLASLARDDDRWLEDQAAGFAHLWQIVDDRAVIEAAALAGLPPAIARRVVERAFRALGANPRGVRDVDQVRAIAAGARSCAQLSSVRVEHSGGNVVLVRCGVSDTVAPHRFEFRFDLPIPGSVRAPEAGWVLDAAGPLPPAARLAERGRTDEVVVDAAAVGSTLTVRNRRRGDRLRPLGLGGRKKVQDLFVDRKVDRADRDQVPIVTDDRGRIVWVAGHALAEEFRVTERTNAVVVLKLRRI